eukprot:Amastigsp_a343408_4.p3 type:complete len:174 gc:universal Amastigsp_a343408_4:240-761(+)
MHDPLLVERQQRKPDLCGIEDGLGRGDHDRAPQQACEVSAGVELHDEDQLGRRLERERKVDDERVAHALEDLVLCADVRDHLCCAQELFRDHFHRVLGPRRHVLHEIHLPHKPRPDPEKHVKVDEAHGRPRRRGVICSKRCAPADRDRALRRRRDAARRAAEGKRLGEHGPSR